MLPGPRLLLRAMTTPTVSPAHSRSQRGVMALLASPRRLWRFLRDPAAPKAPKIIALLAIAYVVSPLDGDWMPILGWLDDIGMSGIALGYLATKAAKYEDAEDVAKDNAAKGGGDAIEVKPSVG